MTQFSPKNRAFFLLFPRMLKCAVLDQPTVDSGGVSREMSVDLAVGCWLYCIVVSIRIGGEIQCLTCAVFLTDPVLQTPLSLIHSFINSVTQSSFSSKSSKYHKSQTIKARELTFLWECSPPSTCHMSHVMYSPLSMEGLLSTGPKPSIS